MTATPWPIRAVEEAIASAAKVTVEDMRSHNRTEAYAQARMAVWFIAKDHLGYSYSKIGRVYNRDHTTIISGVRKMRNSEESKRVLEGVRKVCPDVFRQTRPGEPRTVESWRF